MISDGTFAILKPLVAASTLIAQPVETRIHQRFGVGSQAIADYLRCTLCHRLFDDAVITPCCGETFCRSCVMSRLSSSLDVSVTLSHIDSSSGKDTNISCIRSSHVRGSCPSCKDVIDSMDLESNKVMQDSIEGVLKVGRLQTTNQHNCDVAGGNLKISEDSELIKTPMVQSLPPGTIRQVEVTGVKPIPLGGRLPQSSKKRPIPSSSLSNGNAGENPPKKQAVR